MNLDRLARIIAAGAWLALLAWFWVWLAVLPEPAGKGSVRWAVVVSVLMLLPLPGVLTGRARSLIWAAYLALVWFIVGVVESWSAAGEAWSAGLVVVLAIVFLVAAGWLTRRRR